VTVENVAVTVVCPSSMAVTLPVLSIVATVRSPEDHWATADLSWMLPSENVTIAVRRPVSPFALSDVIPLMVRTDTEAGLGDGAVGAGMVPLQAANDIDNAKTTNARRNAFISFRMLQGVSRPPSQLALLRRGWRPPSLKRRRTTFAWVYQPKLTLRQ
jgi:hypothetical protein